MKSKKILLFCLGLVFLSCTSDEFEEIQSLPPSNEKNYKIDECDAMSIASQYFNHKKTRTSTAPLKIEYVTEQVQSRTQNFNDTTAYIINRGENEGFIIISADKRVFPILAHSDTGHFVNERGSIADIQFTSRIDEYIEANTNNVPIEPSSDLVEEFMETCYYVNPTLPNSWHQGSPYDKYVIEEHPGCPVGCVAVATGMIMSKCKNQITYHNTSFNFVTMNQGITMGDSTAFDQAAKLLYWIGKDVDMTYSPSGSGAMSSKAYTLLDDLGYQTLQNGLVNFCIDDMVRDIKNNYLIYIRGTNMQTGGGHAWVIDGCQYCTSSHAFPSTNPDFSEETIINPYLHCDWGWGGSCNGYFTGNVFSANDARTYHQMTYFSVKIGFSFNVGI